MHLPPAKQSAPWLIALVSLGIAGTSWIRNETPQMAGMSAEAQAAYAESQRLSAQTRKMYEQVSKELNEAPADNTPVAMPAPLPANKPARVIGRFDEPGSHDTNGGYADQ